MMQKKQLLLEFAEGLTIFARYEEGDDYLTPSHDIVHAGPDPSFITSEDLARLEDLGWYQDNHRGCFYKFS